VNVVEQDVSAQEVEGGVRYAYLSRRLRHLDGRGVQGESTVRRRGPPACAGRAVALEPEQQVGSAAAVQAIRL